MNATTEEPQNTPEPDPKEPLNWIHPSLRKLAVPIERLVPHPRNAKRHPKVNLEEIRASLVEHGQLRAGIVTQRPMVLHKDVKSPANTVLVGNGMLAAAKELGWTHLAVLPFDGDDVAARKIALRDNRTSERGVWDFEALSLELRELNAIGVDLTPIGWTPDEAEPLLLAEWSPPPVDENAESGLATSAAKKIGVVKFTPDQWKIVQAAILKLGSADQSDAVVEICRRFLQID